MRDDADERLPQGCGLSLEILSPIPLRRAREDVRHRDEEVDVVGREPQARVGVRSEDAERSSVASDRDADPALDPEVLQRKAEPVLVGDVLEDDRPACLDRKAGLRTRTGTHDQIADQACLVAVRGDELQGRFILGKLEHGRVIDLERGCHQLDGALEQLG